MSSWTKGLSQAQIESGFAALGLQEKIREEYPGAQKFGAKFKKCTLLENVATTYSSVATCKLK